MKKDNSQQQLQGTEKEFLQIFNRLTGAKNSWQVWDDVVTAMACALSNAADPDAKRREKREADYERAVRDYDVEKVAKLFSITTLALERNPDQDFLGAMYMNLNLGSHWHGQFFTPYHICDLMAQVTMEPERAARQVQEHGWISVNDPACGAGATMIAAANTLRRQGINYQTQAVFVGQDIDSVVAKMCFIQLSLLGCPGYVVVANTLTNPLAGDVLLPVEKESQEFWYTPFWWMDIWTHRRTARVLDQLLRKSFKKPEEKEMIFFFDFGKEKEKGNEHHNSTGEIKATA